MTASPAHASPAHASRAVVIDLVPHLQARRRREGAEQSAAAAPVRFITPELVEALQGSWGDLQPNTGPARTLHALHAAADELASPA